MSVTDDVFAGSRRHRFLRGPWYLALMAAVGLAVLGAPAVQAQEEALTLEDEAPADSASGPVAAKAGAFACSITGCTGTFSAMVESVRTVNDGSELVLLRPIVADALRNAGACAGWTGDGLIVSGAGKDRIIDKLHLGFAVDARFHLRVVPSGDDGCKIFYVRIRT